MIYKKASKDFDFNWGFGKESDSIRKMSEKDLYNSINKILSGRNLIEGIWIFGYGSLMWNPGFEIEEKICGEVFGYHRKLCLKSVVYRGTPEYYGLVFGLDEGYSCQGICFRIAPEKLKTELLKLWKREMFAETYIPTWIKVKTEISDVLAVTFIINNEHENYIPKIKLEQVVRRVVKARGKRGTCLDYVKNTLKYLQKSGLRDKNLEQLIELINLNYDYK